MVERTEALKNEAIDRLSPLNSSSVNTFTSFPEINDSNSELEKFVHMDIDPHQQHQIAAHELNASPTTTLTAATTAAAAAAVASVSAAAAAAVTGAMPSITGGVNYSHLGTNVTTTGNTRRHTVGPGDVEHEQALANPSAVPINFKFGSDNAPRLPVNLPMMQNQPLHNFTIKNQHLLKLPTVMEASTLHFDFAILLLPFGLICHINIHFDSGSFGRRASDGGANLQIYYTTSANSGQSVEPIYGNSPNAKPKDLRIGVDTMQQQHNDNMSIALDGNDEQSDEIQR